jgi:pyruvate dehydrogenase E2 component (dihydrolipoamide acetyltransferase)
MPSTREFALPDLGEGLTEAEVVRWLVEVGDLVAVDQPVVEVETAKATVELPCPYGGVVSAVYGAVGEVLAVGRPVLAVTVEEPAGSGNVLVGYGTRAATSATTGRRRERAPVLPVGSDGPAAVSSPVVRKLARQHGLDLSSMTGSGPEGLILRADVTRAINGKSTVDGRIPLRGRRAVAARKFSRSRQEIPDATCWVDADATALVKARRNLAEVGLLALLARICVAALVKYPQFNASVEGEEIVRWPAVHLGFAAQTDRGLAVPVVCEAQRMTLTQLAAELNRLTASARTGALSAAELTGSTFTLNNYGVFGVDGSTPILNHPEAAMIGVGRIADKPWAHKGRLALRKVVQLSFTFDHRVCDGAEAGGFLRFVADRVENPLLLLGEL